MYLAFDLSEELEEDFAILAPLSRLLVHDHLGWPDVGRGGTLKSQKFGENLGPCCRDSENIFA
jgi:hypothetical protein